ncbi:MAG TPA: uracil phosphoribosyltransferase [Anaerolineales bacterium]|nr:uracil phosphoribosyltransferase [Anaerolineales bacterium]HLE73009.1 uracil phosphoribosyltransferase [Anaerolineales bacterium]
MSKVHASTHPLVQHKLTILRDKNTGPRKFRELVREISALLTYEATADLETETRNVETPMGKAKGSATKDNIGLVPILRAGLGMVDGVWDLLPDAQVWHIGLYRDEKTLQPVQYYNKLPTLPTVGACLVLDPMLATGGSATATVSLLKEWGVKNIRYVGIIGAPEGIELLSKTHPDVPIYLGAVDSHLNEIGYIVPGLGDAGDRQFGTG